MGTQTWLQLNGKDVIMLTINSIMKGSITCSVIETSLIFLLLECHPNLRYSSTLCQSLHVISIRGLLAFCQSWCGFAPSKSHKLLLIIVYSTKFLALGLWQLRWLLKTAWGLDNDLKSLSSTSLSHPMWIAQSHMEVNHWQKSRQCTISLWLLEVSLTIAKCSRVNQMGLHKSPSLSGNHLINNLSF